MTFFIWAMLSYMPTCFCSTTPDRRTPSHEPSTFFLLLRLIIRRKLLEI